MGKIKAFFKKMNPLVRFQLSDKFDFSWVKSKKTLIQQVVFFVIKFGLTIGFVAIALWLLSILGIINKAEMVDLYVLFFTLIMVLLLLSDTHNLMLSLYYADDNKLLVTFPVTSTDLFFSKIVVYFISDFVKNCSLLIPVTFGFAIGGIMLGQVSFGVLFWLLIPLILANGVIVLIGSLLSVPYLYIYRLFKTVPILELLIFLAISVLFVIGVIMAIQLIPEDIDLVNQWPSMRQTAQNFIAQICEYVFPFTFVVRSMFGKHGASYLGYRLLGSCFLDAAILLGIFVAFIAICYFVIKPFFFYMMTKSFEFEKNIVDQPKPNKKHRKYLTFVNKELILNIRDIDISGTFLLVYILAPVLLFFMNKVFSAISTRLDGEIMTYAFNIMLIVLPYLASNSVIATLYSKEGRAAYMKKTKPISLIFPLSSKIFFYFGLSIISIVGCGFVFADYASNAGIGALVPILLTISVIFIQFAHMYYSVTLDIMNPQNEVYATVGENNNNPNENKSTLVALIASALVAFVSFGLMRETHLSDGNFNIAFIKLLVISIVAAIASFSLFVLKVKAYYYEK